jgi:putative transposase
MTAAERHLRVDEMESKGLSRRSACHWSGYSRAIGWYPLLRPAQAAKWLEQMRQATRANPRYGYRRIAVVSGLGFGRCWRLWRKHNFQLAAQRARKRNKHDHPVAQPQQAEYPNHVWTYDILFDRLADGKQFKTLSILDEFTRECLGILLAHSILAQDVMAFLSAILKIDPHRLFYAPTMAVNSPLNRCKPGWNKTTLVPFSFRQDNLGRTVISKVFMISSTMSACNASVFSPSLKPMS